MKYIIIKSIRGALLTGALLTLQIAQAQVVEKTEVKIKTVTAQGTITEWGDQRLLLKTETAPEAVPYTFSETTTYVDEDGNPVSVTTIKPGAPVTVYYTKSGDAMVATKVLVRTKAAAPAPVPGTTTTEVTKTIGTIREYGKNRILLKTEVATEPTAYTFSKTTTYVDEAGNPVSVETVKSGLPVTVYYTKVGDAMVASKVVVRKVVTTPAAPPIVETKKTTTTTETKK